MNAETQDFLTELRARLVTSQTGIGQEVVEATRESISTWCPEYHTGHGGHAPNNRPPYFESGALTAGIFQATEELDSGTIRTTICSQRDADSSGGESDDVPQILEFGSEEHLAHPYMRPQLDELQETFLSRLAERLNGGGSDVPF